MSIQLRSDVTVKLVEGTASDRMVVAAARVSTQGTRAEEWIYTPPEDSFGLINFLMKNRHGTPFEHNMLTFLIEAPIFVFREFHRHRIGWSYNEVSGRYRELEPVYYVPSRDRPLVQTGKPGHYEFQAGDEAQHRYTIVTLENVYRQADAEYRNMLRAGVAKEVARACLPVGTYTAMFATCNARSLMAFLGLRTRDDRATFPSKPQWEIELVAQLMEAEWTKLMPLTSRAFNENGRVSP